MSGFKIFQFHKGTIKTNYTIICKFIQNKFQFHKGTIKTFSPLSDKTNSW